MRHTAHEINIRQSGERIQVILRGTGDRLVLERISTNSVGSTVRQTLPVRCAEDIRSFSDADPARELLQAHYDHALASYVEANPPD